MENLGKSDGLITKSPRRLILTPTYDSSEVVNKIAISSLVSDELPISVLQTLYDTWWHIDTDNKMMATPQLSELTFTDSDPTKSESEWYERVMQDPTRDLSFLFNDISPRVIEQFSALATAGTALSFYIVTSDDKLVGKFDGEYLAPFQIQTGSLFVGLKKLSGWEEHAKDIIEFRMNEGRSMDNMFAIPISGGFVTSDDDHWSMIDGTCVVSLFTADGVTLTVTKTAKNPTTGVNDPITGIAFDEIVADGTGDDSPAASGNWVESPDGVYTWLETGVFTGDLTKVFEFSSSKIDVASVTATGS